MWFYKFQATSDGLERIIQSHIALPVTTMHFHILSDNASNTFQPTEQNASLHISTHCTQDGIW